MAHEYILIGPSKVWYAPVGEANPDNASVAYGADWGGNWTYLGDTLEPVAMAPEQVVKRFRKAGRLGTSLIHNTNAGVRLQTVMAEQSGDLLKLVWGGPGTVLNSGIERQPVGFPVVLPTYKWGLETQYLDSGVWYPIRYFFHRGSIRWVSDVPFGRKVVGGVPVAIDMLIDDSQPAGQEFGSSEVPTTSATLPTPATKIGAFSSLFLNIEDLSMTGLSLTDGDLIMLHFHHDNAAETITPPSGFTEAANTLNGSVRSRIYYKVASSEPSTYVMDGTAVSHKFMVVSAWRGSGTLAPDQAGGQANSSGQYHWASITPTAQPGTLFHFMWATGNTIHFSPPTGLTEAYDVSGIYGCLYLMTVPYAGLSATATQTVTRDNVADGISITQTINVPMIG